MTENGVRATYRTFARQCFKLEWVLAILVVYGLVGLCYGATIDYSFLYWDTRSYILSNKCIHELSLSNLECIFTEIYFVNWHPLTSLTYAIEYHFFGDTPGPYHVTNMFIHGLNGLLLYAVSKTILLRQGVAAQVSVLSAALAAILFIVHPQHVESVAWIADRKGLLSTAFLLLSLYFYIQYVDGGCKRRHWYLAFIAFAAALMSKPMAVTWPVLLLLLDIYPLQRLECFAGYEQLKRDIKKRLSEKIPYFILTAMMICITLYGQSEGGAMIRLDALPISFRIMNAVHSVFFYFQQWLFPLELSPFYVYPDFLLLRNWPLILLLISAFILISMAAVFFLFKRKPALFVIWCFILVALSPVLGIIQVGSQAAADRYTYFPLIPLFLLAGLGVVQSFRFISRYMSALMLVLVFSAIVFFVNITQEQTKLWKNDVILWGYVIQKKSVGNNIMPLIGFAEASHVIGDHETAIEYYLKADAIGKFPLASQYVFFARSYSAVGQDEYARQLYQFAQAQWPEDKWLEKTAAMELKAIDKRHSDKPDN